VLHGLALIWEGNVTLFSAAVCATAVITLLSLVGPDWGRLAMVRTALLGAAGLATVVGLALNGWGEVLCLAVPAAARARIQVLVTLVLGSASAVFGITSLAWLGMQGFDVSAVSRGAVSLALVSLLCLLGRMVAFSTLLRRIAFALRHYRIAQGSVGFIVFIGVGLAVVGLVNLLFQSARPAAQTFAELLALAFALLVVLWYLSMLRRSRELVRARLQ
jgi:hypothetical protein